MFYFELVSNFVSWQRMKYKLKKHIIIYWDNKECSIIELLYFLCDLTKNSIIIKLLP